MSYTTFIEQGKINNARDFMKLCLRNFGIMQEHYQDPFPTGRRRNDGLVQQQTLEDGRRC